VNEEIARRIVEAAVSLDKELGKIDTAIGKISDGQERKEFAKRLGDLIGHVNDWFIRPLVRKYPSLEPGP